MTTPANNMTISLTDPFLIQQSFGYDAASRLSTVADGNGNTAGYLYLANSPLVSQIAFKQSGVTRMTTTKAYDDLNRLTQVSSQAGAAGVPALAFNYAYNTANQRTQDRLADGSYWVYGYDSLGQVTSGHKYFYDHTPVPGQEFDYTFDTIGNRTQTKAGGDQTGGNQRMASYAVNNLNQITSRDYPGTNDVVGVALATNSVTVNGLAAFHKWEYFWGTVKTNNTAAPAWLGVAVGSGGGTNMGSLYLAQTPEQFSYDPDGNLTGDGRWTYTWDAENRLIGMAVRTAAGPPYQLAFAYDARGRRIQKTVTNGNAVTVTDFLYDGWNLVAALTPQSSLLQSFLWGSDLSGSMQGAGGVGGLLEVSYHGNSTTNCFPAFDGNGNLAALVNAADGTVAANYEYGPFGEVIRATGPMAKANPFRFSTKYQDDESDLLYYGYRYYKASTGTWVNRDPLDEDGGINLYAFVLNAPINSIDEDGREASLTVKFEKNKSKGLPCGGWDNHWLWIGNVDNLTWLVQKISVDRIWVDCDMIHPTHETDGWFEATLLPASYGMFTGEDRDNVSSVPNTIGVGESVTADIKFFPDSKYGKTIRGWGHQVPYASHMYSTRSEPTWWKGGPTMGSRKTWEVKWQCCCGPQDDGTVLHNP
jgi:RHS repeat-associated protein